MTLKARPLSDGLLILFAGFVQWFMEPRVPELEPGLF